MIKNSVLEKNRGRDAIVKFFHSETGQWNLVGYGGMGNMEVLDSTPEFSKALDKELNSDNLEKIKEMYIPQIKEKGILYYKK